MLDERALVSRLEAADTEELSRLFVKPTATEEKVLRIYLGDERFRCMRNLSLRSALRLSEVGEQTKGNVVFIPGILGSELTSKDQKGARERVWLDSRRIVAGDLVRLRLDGNGLAEDDSTYRIRCSGVLKNFYGQLILSLAENWNVHAFAYDWRKDFRLAAAQLQARINTWFPEKDSVHIVAHAEGGLVARAYLQAYPGRWNQGGRLVMLGTPNQGSYSAVSAISGDLDLIRQIDLLDSRHSQEDFRSVIKSFPSIYQLLPSPKQLSPEHSRENLEKLYRPETYGSDTEISPEHLSNARDFHELLAQAPFDPERMVQIAGHAEPTMLLKDIDALPKLFREPASEENRHSAFTSTCNGDGRVPHHQAILSKDGNRIPAFFIDSPGSTLCSHPQVLSALEELLDDKKNPELQHSTFHQSLARLTGLKPMSDSMYEPTLDHSFCRIDEKQDQSRMDSLLRRINVRGQDSISKHYIAPEERDISQSLMRGLMCAAPVASGSRISKDMGCPKIKIRVVIGDITDQVLRQVDQTSEAQDESNSIINADAIAMGHYSGNKPHGIMRVLDRKISLAMMGHTCLDDDEKEESQTEPEYDESDLLLTQFSQRGTLRGELAEPFFLPDPRGNDRMIAIAGMGEPGRFGVPELTLLTRELSWSLGRLGRRHLAAVLIGTGRDNLDVSDAICGWIHGLKLAITGASDSGSDDRSLNEITFFLRDPQKVVEADEAILAEKQALESANRMDIEYQALSEPEKLRLKSAAIDHVQKQLRDRLDSPTQSTAEAAPTRITVGIHGNTYRFGAITNHASIPEREIPLDPALVRRANNELATAQSTDQQLHLGQFMERLLIPEDLRGQLSGNAPLVMMLDSTTARIHWELLAQSELISTSRKWEHRKFDAADPDGAKFSFFGTSRGFTRQLRTVFAPPPEPPPARRRLLRVLVVADPAEDAHLPGAEEEGIEVGDLFDRFNVLHGKSGNRVEVVRLFGPREATRTAVLRHLMMRTYDVLHFAGHCVYDKENPAGSGWIFSNGERLSAYEISRVDRSPSLVFSNACESGITPARSDERAVDLAPCFAESFFAQGVNNFVCTAWPVDDRAARHFALTLYANLLGLSPKGSGGHLSGVSEYQVKSPESMHVAMQQARLRIFDARNDPRTWGAYQHYGNPYFRFFDPTWMHPKKNRKPSSRGKKRKKKVSKAPR